MELTFINDLFESRMFSSKSSMSRYNAEDVAEMTFLYFLGLQILKSEFSTSRFAEDYIYKTFKNDHFDKITSNSTDLDWLLYVLVNRDSKLLNQHPSNVRELNKISINKNVLSNWARQAVKGRSTTEVDRRFFIMLENMLNIRNTNYKSIKTLASEWNDLDSEQQQLAMTRLLFAFRSKLSRSEILDKLEDLSNENRLEISGAHNPEKESTPSKNSVIKKIMTGAMLGAAAVLPIANAVKNYRDFKSKLDAMSPIKENAVASGTCAGSIASVVQPIATVRRKKEAKVLKKAKKEAQQ